MPGARGEGHLQREDGEEIAVLFTNRALADCERITGKSVLQLVNAMGSNGLGIGDLAQILGIGLEHARRESKSRPQSYTVNDAFALLDELGFGEVAGVVFRAVADVLGYSKGREAPDNPPV